MAYDLFNQSTELCRKLSSQSWAKALELAQFYGWQPMGTRPPSIYDFHGLDADWSGPYPTKHSQIVKTGEAQSLAYPFQKFLDDFSDFNNVAGWNTTHCF